MKIGEIKYNFLGNIWTIKIEDKNKVWIEKFNTHADAKKWVEKQNNDK